MAQAVEEPVEDGAALNDTAQEIGASIGTAVVGTLIAVLVTTALPNGTWPAALAFVPGARRGHPIPP